MTLCGIEKAPFPIQQHPPPPRRRRPYTRIKSSGRAGGDTALKHWLQNAADITCGRLRTRSSLRARLFSSEAPKKKKKKDFFLSRCTNAACDVPLIVGNLTGQNGGKTKQRCAWILYPVLFPKYLSVDDAFGRRLVYTAVKLLHQLMCSKQICMFLHVQREQMSSVYDTCFLLHITSWFLGG